MSDARQLLVRVAEQLFAAQCTKETIDAVEDGDWPEALWGELEDAGLEVALCADEDGGAGLKLADALFVMRAAGRHAAPVPLADTMLANMVLTLAHLPVGGGPLALTPCQPGDELRLERKSDGWWLEADLGEVPWPDRCAAIVAVAGSPDGPRAARWRPPRESWQMSLNPAGEPRGAISGRFELPADAVRPLPNGIGADIVVQLGAMSRVALIAGGLERILDLTVDYARERQQFGRPIGRFQAIQQQIAVLAGDCVAVSAAFEAAAELARDPNHAATAVAAAKARAGDAVTRGCAIAHQVHGAIGFTHEHELHQTTRRLWAWRDECGSEHYWAEMLGALTLRGGGESFWARLAG